MSNIKEFVRLKKTLLWLKDFDANELDFQKELAIIRAFEEVGGIAKQFSNFGITFFKKDQTWKKAIATRDKIAHSYDSMDIDKLVIALKSISYLILTLDEIEKEINKAFSIN